MSKASNTAVLPTSDSPLAALRWIADVLEETKPITAEGIQRHVAHISAYLNALADRAGKEPLGTDISDRSDEWCAGFLAGQTNAFEEIARGL
jgi:hypothetical protein